MPFIDERFIHTKRPVSNRGYTRDVRPPAQVGLLLPWFEVSYKSTEICKCNALHVQISLDLWETSDRVLIPFRSWTKTNTIFLHCSNQVSVVNIRTVTESTVETKYYCPPRQTGATSEPALCLSVVLGAQWRKDRLTLWRINARNERLLTAATC